MIAFGPCLKVFFFRVIEGVCVCVRACVRACMCVCCILSVTFE